MENTAAERESIRPGDSRLLTARRFIGAMGLMAALCLGVELRAQEQEEVDSAEYLERLEWRGILAMPGETQFSLHDTAGKEGFWISLGESRNGIEVVEYDRNQNDVTLRHGDARRTLSLSGSSIQALEEAPSDGPPPLVVVGEQPEEGATDKNPFEAGPVGELWQQAIEGSPDLREIDQQFQRLNQEQEQVAEAVSMTPPEAPEYPEMLARQRELNEQRRVLTEGALTGLRESSTLSRDEGRQLSAQLRSDYLSKVQGNRGPPGQAEQNGETSESEGGARSEEPNP